jgi:hypothetical protein
MNLCFAYMKKILKFIPLFQMESLSANLEKNRKNYPMITLTHPGQHITPHQSIVACSFSRAALDLSVMPPSSACRWRG